MDRISLSKFLYTNGCSMTYGEEIVPHYQRAQKCYPAILARKMNLDLVNDAITMASNERIVRTTMEFISDYLYQGGSSDDLHVLIGWTEVNRREFFNSLTKEWQLFLPCCYDKLRLKQDQKLWQAYYPDFEDENEDFARTLRQIIFLQDFLTTRRISFYFVACLGYYRPILENHLSLLNLINSENFMGLDEWLNFHTWSQENHFPMGQGQHPLGEAHDAWADLIFENWKII